VVQTLWKIMNERQDYDYDKRNISVVICDTNILNGYPAQVMVTSVKLSKWWVCLSTNGLWLVLLYPKLFLIASHCIYVCIGRYFKLKNIRDLHLMTVSLLVHKFSWNMQITWMNNVGYKPLHFHCKTYLVHTMRLYICEIKLEFCDLWWFCFILRY
jgi:hypothetical protein